MNYKIITIGLFSFLLMNFSQLFAQAETPTTFFLPPKGLTAVNFQYLNLKSNLSPSQDVALANGQIEVNGYVVPMLYSFDLGGRLAQVLITPTYGSIKGTVDVSGLPETFPIDLPEEIEFIDKTGLMDSGGWIRVGLHNTPALNIADFSQLEQKFQIFALFGITAPIGEYDQLRRVNLGSNRWAFRFGLPMVVPLNSNKQKSASWEFVPNLYLYTNNNSPFTGQTKRQDPLFALNQHFSKNFTPKLWGSVDIGYQYGGTSQIDNLPKGEVINQLAGGLSLGYSLGGAFKAQTSYGRIWFNSESGHMFRLLVTMAIPSKSDRDMLKNMQK